MTRRQTAMAMNRPRTCEARSRRSSARRGTGSSRTRRPGRIFFFTNRQWIPTATAALTIYKSINRLSSYRSKHPKGHGPYRYGLFAGARWIYWESPRVTLPSRNRPSARTWTTPQPSHPRRNRDASGNRHPTGEGRPAALARVARYRASHFTAGGEAVRRNGGDGSATDDSPLGALPYARRRIPCIRSLFRGKVRKPVSLVS